MRILDSAKVPYTPFGYEITDGKIDGVSVAGKIDKDPAQVFKTLVTVGASKQYYVFLVPVAHELSLKKAAQHAGEKSVEMIKSADLLKITGYVHGGCSPLGMKKPFRTFIDQSAQSHETIIVSAGKIGAQVGLAPQTLAQLAGAVFQDLCQ